VKAPYFDLFSTLSHYLLHSDGGFCGKNYFFRKFDQSDYLPRFHSLVNLERIRGWKGKIVESCFTSPTTLDPEQTHDTTAMISYVQLGVAQKVPCDQI